MRLIYIDVDSLRPDHLGCYGYHRETSPNIDRVAERGIRFTNCYVSDAPCLPSRTAFFAGRPGALTGVVNHGGVASQPFIEGVDRGFRDRFSETALPAVLRRAGLNTVLVSSFAERHSAWHWYAGFNEIFHTATMGLETADEVGPRAIQWLDQNAEKDDWYLHINFWDPHTPYRTPKDFEADYSKEPLPEWYNEEVRRRHWEGYGPHSAHEVTGFNHEVYDARIKGKYPDQPKEIDSMNEARRVFDGYDRGVKYVDHQIGLIMDMLEKQGVLDDTAVIISGDHGENLGELNIYGDHHTADEFTTHVPLIVSWPGVTREARVDESLLYHFDMGATMAELAGGDLPKEWFGKSFAKQLQEEKLANPRDYLVVSQAAWTCQRGVRFDYEEKRYIAIRSYHDGYHDFPDVMLFNLTDDPHEQHNIAESKENIVNMGMRHLTDWESGMMRLSKSGVDPMWTVVQEGGPFHTRGELGGYIVRLRETERSGCAERLRLKHLDELYSS
ncbi:Choline-sulfatase [Poriferisphaera corsica]|uniref:Choline-sulfatase n=1 Tax=Poriferisphaera corsica TaxID=2528020 RepID=A0A517YYQ2_9BACT|nr:sulfatase [Poriferisphaera corsica]QDU35348.1 Choline-sulfatase [Poriferisphaera corsica]